MDGDGGVRIGEGVGPPGVQELPYGIRLLLGPLPPLAPEDHPPHLVHAEHGLHPAGDERPGELGQYAAQHRALVPPVGCRPRAVQEARVEHDVRDLQQREFLLAAPVAVALDLAAPSGHAAEDDGQAVQGAFEPEPRGSLVDVHRCRNRLAGTPDDFRRPKIRTLPASDAAVRGSGSGFRALAPGIAPPGGLQDKLWLEFAVPCTSSPQASRQVAPRVTSGIACAVPRVVRQTVFRSAFRTPGRPLPSFVDSGLSNAARRGPTIPVMTRAPHQRRPGTAPPRGRTASPCSGAGSL